MPILLNDMAKFSASKTIDRCHINVLWFKMLPAAFVSSTISLSVLLQTFVFLATSAMADYGELRKRMLILTGLLGGLLTTMVIFTQNDLYMLLGLLLLLSNLFYGYSIVFYNAFLAPIIRGMPEYREATKDAQAEVLDQLSNKLSTRGYMIGYGTGVLLLLLTIPIVLFTPKNSNAEWYICEKGVEPSLQYGEDVSLALRISVFICGVWWIALTIFPMLWIKKRPGPPLPQGKNYITASLSNVWHTLKAIKKLKNTFVFLVAYFIFSDAYTTISYVGILFAKNDMNASSFVLIILLVEVPLLALVGNFFFLYIKGLFHLDTKTIISINLTFLLFLPTYAFIGFIPSAPFGMKYIWELYLFGGIYGFNIGSIQSFSRTSFISMTPPGHESEFFGFYELTDKGSAWIGPAMVALLTEWTGHIRYSFLYLWIALFIPIIILHYVDVKLGTLQAKAFSEAENSEPMIEFGRLEPGEEYDDEEQENDLEQVKKKKKSNEKSGSNVDILLEENQTDQIYKKKLY